MTKLCLPGLQCFNEKKLLCLAIWCGEGLRRVTSRLKILNSRISAICYMDNKTSWSNNFPGAMAQIESWNACWGRTVGITESLHKTQIMIKSPDDHSYLTQHYPQWLVEEVHALGVSIASKRRGATAQEESCMAKATSRACLLGVTPWGWPLKIRAFQSLIISKAAYGWVGTDPSKKNISTLSSLCLLVGRTRVNRLPAISEKYFTVQPAGCLGW